MAPKKGGFFEKKLPLKKPIFHEKSYDEFSHIIKDFGHEESVGFALSSGAHTSMSRGLGIKFFI